MTGRLHPLDRPAWSALVGRQAGLERGDPAAAVRVDADFGVFSGAVDAVCWQMVADRLTPSPDRPLDVLPLGDDEASDMIALATLTRSGPFFRRTHRLGGFIGLRQDGALIAMAGGRLRPEGFTEVSGVCTHADHRGRAYTGALMRRVAGRILARGETPVLHAYAGGRRDRAVRKVINLNHLFGESDPIGKSMGLRSRRACARRPVPEPEAPWLSLT